MVAFEQSGGLENYESKLWSLIAYASRYGHQPVLLETGPLTVDKLIKFCDALKEFVDAEQKNGRSHAMNMAEGGG